MKNSRAPGSDKGDKAVDGCVMWEESSLLALQSNSLALGSSFPME